MKQKQIPFFLLHQIFISPKILLYLYMHIRIGYIVYFSVAKSYILCAVNNTGILCMNLHSSYETDIYTNLVAFVLTLCTLLLSTGITSYTDPTNECLPFVTCLAERYSDKWHWQARWVGIAVFTCVRRVYYIRTRVQHRALRDYGVQLCVYV